MNHRRPWWIVFSLLPPLIGLCALIVPSGCGGGGGSSPTAQPTDANVAVALVGQGPQGNFRSVLLNISGIRLNKTVDAATNSPGWITLAVPPQAGSGNGQNPGDLQIDLLHTQTAATIYNVSGAQPGTYNTVQILVDQTDPGTIVPACQSGNSNGEGCISYGMLFSTNNLAPILVNLATPISVVKNAVVPLVIQLAVSIVQTPATTGGTYMVAIDASETNAGTFLASINGTITTKGTPPAHILPLSVSAELSGTNTVLETVPVGSKGVYALELPAAPTGTSYDVFTNGGGASYAALQGITVTPGQFVGGEDMTITGLSPGSVAGVIADGCTSVGIAGAQLQLLAPAQNVPTPTAKATPPASFCLDQPGQCVVVASAFADQTGVYPIPGTKKNPAGFTEVPTGQQDLAFLISASGYSTLPSSIFVKGSKTEICSAASSDITCNFSLTTGYINGTVNLVTDPPPGNSVTVQVFAENSGTNNLVSSLTQPLTFVNHQTSLPFTLNVPVAAPTAESDAEPTPAPAFDLFAVAIDPFQGGAAPFPGHDIPVLSGIAAPSAPCLSVPPGPPSPAPSPTPIAFAPMNCVGHGSLSGTVINPDDGTSVEVEKPDPTNMTPVQILGTTPSLFSSVAPSNNAYTLCVPPDDYLVQRFETDTFVAGQPTPSPTPVGDPVSVTVAQPAPTSSPCPSSCSNTNTGPGPCPGQCNGTVISPL